MGQKELMVHSPLAMGFAAGVYVSGPKELMCWFIILSDTSLEYYFSENSSNGSKRINGSFSPCNGFCCWGLCKWSKRINVLVYYFV
jgi:hypothetical protein